MIYFWIFTLGLFIGALLKEFDFKIAAKIQKDIDNIITSRNEEWDEWEKSEKQKRIRNTSSSILK